MLRKKSLIPGSESFLPFFFEDSRATWERLKMWTRLILTVGIGCNLKSHLGTERGWYVESGNLVPLINHFFSAFKIRKLTLGWGSHPLSWCTKQQTEKQMDIRGQEFAFRKTHPAITLNAHNCKQCFQIMFILFGNRRLRKLLIWECFVLFCFVSFFDHCRAWHFQER